MTVTRTVTTRWGRHGYTPCCAGSYLPRRMFLGGVAGGEERSVSATPRVPAVPPAPVSLVPQAAACPSARQEGGAPHSPSTPCSGTATGDSDTPMAHAGRAGRAGGQAGAGTRGQAGSGDQAGPRGPEATPRGMPGWGLWQCPSRARPGPGAVTVCRGDVAGDSSRGDEPCGGCLLKSPACPP